MLNSIFIFTKIPVSSLGSTILKWILGGLKILVYKFPPYDNKEDYFTYKFMSLI